MLNFTMTKCLINKTLIILFYLTQTVLTYSVDLSAAPKTTNATTNNIKITTNASNITKPVVIYCDIIPIKQLSVILGSAYNPRYMSIEEPDFTEELIDAKTGKIIKQRKRKTGSKYDSFYVDNEFTAEISDDPAWLVKHANVDSDGATNTTDSNMNNNKNRTQRSVRRGGIAYYGPNLENSLHGIDINLGGNTNKFIIDPRRPWTCDSKIIWLDLGGDYFPRYLRNVECTNGSCWYGHFICKPRSFTVKILRRRNGECVMVEDGGKIGVDGLPRELRDKWVWEERAVNFCCDCAIP